jgi:hypothetical protein
MKTKDGSVIMLSFFSLLFSLNPYSQTQPVLFSSSTREALALTDQQATKLDTMIQNPIYLGHFFVQVNALAGIQEDGNIRVNLPDKQGAELFVGKAIEYTSPDDFVYYGELDPCDAQERVGYIHLLAKNGDVFGQINLEEEIYELQDYGGGKNVLFKIDPAIYTEMECGVNSVQTPQRHTGRMVQELGDSRSHDCCVRVLFLFTRAAEAVGNPINSANLYIQQTRAAVLNSKANACFTLAGVAGLPEFVEDGDDTEGAIETLNNVRLSPLANQLRDSFQADIVLLLTDGNWNPPLGKQIGIAFLDEWGDPDFAFALAEIDAAGGLFTATHEMAHLFGCKHHDDNRGAPDFVFSARAHQFFTGFIFTKQRFTILRPVRDVKHKILHFSNPDVKLKNKPTGVPNQNNNEDQISAEACHVSNYLDYVPPFSVNISGPNFGQNNVLYTWCANLTSCNNLTSIVWEYSTDGFTYSTTPPFPAPLPAGDLCVQGILPWNEDLYIRVTATCEDGSTDMDWHFTQNNNQAFPCGGAQLNRKSEQIDFEAKSSASGGVLTKPGFFRAYPNPVMEELTIEFQVAGDEKVNMELIDPTGKRIGSIVQNSSYLAGKQIETIDMTSLPSGYYFLHVKIGEQWLIEKVNKQ